MIAGARSSAAGGGADAVRRAGPSGHSSTVGPSSSTARHAQAAAMEDFLTTYLATVTSDQHAAWEMLTPAFQEESGGFGLQRSGAR